jgi:hypothetical protein
MDKKASEVILSYLHLTESEILQGMDGATEDRNLHDLWKQLASWMAQISLRRTPILFAIFLMPEKVALISPMISQPSDMLFMLASA